MFGVRIWWLRNPTSSHPLQQYHAAHSVTSATAPREHTPDRAQRRLLSQIIRDDYDNMRSLRRGARHSAPNDHT